MGGGTSGRRPGSREGWEFGAGRTRRTRRARRAPIG